MKKKNVDRENGEGTDQAKVITMRKRERIINMDDGEK